MGALPSGLRREAWLSSRLPQSQFQLRRRLGAGPVAAEPAICEWRVWGGDISGSCWKAIEWRRWRRRPGGGAWLKLVRGRQRRDYAEERNRNASRCALAARARVGRRRAPEWLGWVGGRRRREGHPSRRRVRWRLLAGASLQRRGHRDGGPREAPIVRSPKASVRAELPQSVFTKGHHTRSCPSLSP